MVDKVRLSAKERDLKGKKVKHLRKEGLLPLVVYGKDKKPVTLEVNAHDFAMMYKMSGGNTIIEVEIEKIDGSKEKKNVLIHEVALDPVKSNILHADLLQIKMNEKITTSVPLRFVGDSVAVIDLQGSLLTPKSEVEVECLPANIPHEIEVDIAPLADFEAVLHISDIVVPAEVTILDDPEETIAYVEAPRTDEELEEIEGEVEAEIPAEEGEETPAEETATEE